MTKTGRSLLLIVAAALLTASLGGQPQVLDLRGPWSLQAVAQLPPAIAGDDGGSCVFEGAADVTQDGSALGGDAALTRVDGPQGCPPEMDAALSGEVVGSRIEMGMLLSDDLGEADFTGAVGRGAPLQGGGTTMSGTMTVTAGPFLGSTGTWSGIQGTLTVLEIPTLSAAGLTLLVVLLLLLGGWTLRRRELA